MAGLAIFFHKTPVGRALRAVADDHQAAMSVGIPLKTIWVIVWSVAGIVALDDEDGESFLLSYHYYDADDDGVAKLGLRTLRWEDGWPVAGAVIE